MSPGLITPSVQITSALAVLQVGPHAGDLGGAAAVDHKAGLGAVGGEHHAGEGDEVAAAGLGGAGGQLGAGGPGEGLGAGGIASVVAAVAAIRAVAAIGGVGAIGSVGRLIAAAVVGRGGGVLRGGVFATRAGDDEEGEEEAWAHRSAPLWARYS